MNQEQELLKLLRWAYSNLPLTVPKPDLFGEIMEYDFCVICHQPEWEHKDDCEGIAWKKAVKKFF
jgi:hypothetical protein